MVSEPTSTPLRSQVPISLTGNLKIHLDGCGVYLDLSHAQPQRVFAGVLFCDEAAFEVFAAQVDFVLARDALWRHASCVRRIPRVDPYFAAGDALALAVGDAPIAVHKNEKRRLHFAPF